MLSVAEIVSEVHQSLGSPPADWLSIRDVVSLVRSRLAYRLTRVFQSDQNQNTVAVSFRLGLSPSEDPNDPDNPIADPREQILADIGTPVWAERRIAAGNGTSGEYWEYIPTVNLDSLEDWRNEGMAAVAFYRDSSLDYLKMRYTFAPDEIAESAEGDNFRIWYDPLVDVATALDSESALPANFNYMIVDDVLVSAIPVMMNNVARFSNMGEIIVSDLQIKAWQGLQQAAATRMMLWEGAFNEYRNRSKGSQRGRTRRNVLRSRTVW